MISVFSAIYWRCVEVKMEAGFIPVVPGSVGNAVPPGTTVAPSANVIRAPGLKRGKMEEAISDRVRLFQKIFS